jgi:chemotaxis-related protein WspD
MSHGKEHPMENCWKEVGVSGDFSCERLAEMIHCRNCREYNKAGRQLLDREIPAEFLEEWTRGLTEAKEEEAQETVSVIVFRIQNEWLAMKTICLQETANLRPVHHIPLRSNNVFKGVANVNGELLLCMSAADLLEYGMEGAGEGGQETEKAFRRMLVVRLEGERYIFPVDEVMGIYRVSLSELYNPPATLTKSPTTLIKGIFDFSEKRIGLLDEDKFRHALKRSLTP